MGALTAKPYAFSYRSWKTQKFPFYDIFESLISKIELETISDSIVRVLPKSATAISNKIRFFYDFVKSNTINYCYYFGIEVSFETALEKIYNYFFSLNKVKFILNNFIDLNLINGLKLLNKTKGINYYQPFEFENLNLIKEVELKPIFIFLNLNLRYDFPIFLYKLKNFNKKTDLINFYSIGPNFGIRNLGSAVQNLLFGKFKLKKLYLNFSSIKFFSNNNNNLTLSLKFKHLKLSKNTYFDTNYFNLLNLAQNNFFYENLKFLNNNKKNTTETLLLNYDKDLIIKDNLFNVFISSNNFLINNNYKLIIPIKNILESKSNFIDGFNSKFITLEAMALITETYRNNLIEFQTILNKFCSISTTLFNNNNKKFEKVLNLMVINSEMFHYSIQNLNLNYYITDQITKNSKLLNLQFISEQNKYQKYELCRFYTDN